MLLGVRCVTIVLAERPIPSGVAAAHFPCTCRPGLTKVQLAEISVQCKELYSKALKQQAAAGYAGQPLPLLSQATGDPGSKGWKFWKS
jgi:hypothetical protein